MRKLKLLLTVICALSLLGTGTMLAQGWTASEAGTGNFYLYNVGANAYLENGASWGTHAALKSSGFVVNVTQNNGVYTIGTNSKYSGKFFTDNGYVDTGNSTNWIFEPVEGLTNTYKLKTAGGSYAFAASGMYNLCIGADPGTNKAYWKLVTADNRNAVANASAQNPVELTHKINNPRFDDDNSSWQGAPTRGGNTGGTNGNADSYNDRNPCAEHWNKTYDTYQTLTDLPSGTYAVSVQGFYREGNTANAASKHLDGTESLNAVLYANDEEQPLMSIIEGAGLASGGKTVTATGVDGAIPNDMAAASYFFSAGLYWNTVYVTVTDGTLKIGIKKSVAESDDWTIFDNFRLQYFGECTINEAKNAALLKAFDVALAAAEAFENEAMEASAKTALSNALTTARALNKGTATAEQLTNATKALNDAVALAEPSAAIYAQIKPLVDGLYVQNPSFGGKTKYENGTYKTLSEVYSDYYTYAISNLSTESGTDYTMAIINPGFEFANTIGWTYQSSYDSGARSTSNDTYKMTNSEGDWLFNTWSAGYPITQTISGLPNGLYQVTAVVANNSDGDPAKVYLLANNAHEGITCNTSAGVGVEGHVSVVINDGTLTIGAVGSNNDEERSYIAGGVWWYKVDNFRLTYMGEVVSDEVAAELIAQIPTGKMSQPCSEALQTAKTNLESEKSLVNYNALVAAIDEANASIANYQLVDSGVIPTNNSTGWTISTTKGALACNTWSTEGNSDGSGMTTPFIQDWAASGNALGEGALYYEIDKLTPGEFYRVSALVRAYNEAGGAVDGAKFFVNNGFKSLDEVGIACTNGKYGTFSVVGEVNNEGKLRFGMQLESTSAINWLSIKDVTIAVATGKKPTAIALSEHPTTMTTGSQMTITATVTPDDADDKLVIWTSSDESVASVSNGLIKALKAGTTTITATATDGDNVQATTNITVADAAAPSFYSTTIEAGDYYIVNAATGMFLGGANSWGTQASLIEHGIPFTAALSDGKYTLDSHTYNNADSHFFNGTYVDGASTNLFITSLSDGKFTISTADGSEYVTALTGSTVVNNSAADANSTYAQWYFLSKNDRNKMLQAATAMNPVDATYYVKQANPSRNLSAGALNENAWSQYNVGGTQDNSNFAAQVYNATVDNYQTINNIPNGTYTVSVQAFTSGTDVKFYANDQKVDVKNNDSGASSCSAASALFAQNLYPNTVTVTVTNRTLKIGFEGDCTSNKWLCYDKVEMYMTGYTANTGVTASIDKEEIQIGQTAQVSATTIPATASFNDITSYSSSDESIATVDENGVVTGVAVGTATITVVANEMENNSTTVDITVTLVTPTAFELSETEVGLDKDKTSATLTITPTPDGANTAATWTSSDETVATVSNGVVTAVSTGTATITATSIIDNKVSAQATVTVTFPESTVPATYYVNNGATRTVYTLGENLIKNGSFGYPNAVYGWKTIDYTTDAVASNFTINATGGVNDGAYITTAGGGVGSEKTLRKSIAVEKGKKYYFSVYTSGKAPTSGNFQYNALFKMSNATTESGTIKQFEWPQGAGNTTTEWSKTECIFTAETDYVGVRMGWNSDTKFDEFVLVEVTDETTEGNVDYATAAIPAANIGTGVFQYSQDAIDAANALVQGTATVEEVQAAYEAVTTLNAPDAEKRYALSIVEAGKAWNGNAITFMAGARNDQGGYGVKYFAPQNQNLAQALLLTHTTGNKYKISIKKADGNEQYLTTAKLGYNTGSNEQIRTTDDASKALEVEIKATTTDGQFQLYNTAASKLIANNNNNDVYTANSANFTIAEAAQASITINTTAAGWGTVILPFAQELPAEVKAYTCSAVDGNKLTLVEANALEANKPYLIEGAWDETVTGDAQGTALTYTEGLFTGVYTATAAPVGSYVLQLKNEKLGFYKVAEGKQPNAGANRAYLTVPAAEAREAFFFGDGETTAIQALKALSEGNAEIYDVNGVRQNTLVKGMNILKMSDGSIRKVMVK